MRFGLINQHTAIFYVIVIASVVAYDVLVHPEFARDRLLARSRLLAGRQPKY